MAICLSLLALAQSNVNCFAVLLENQNYRRNQKIHFISLDSLEVFDVFDFVIASQDPAKRRRCSVNSLLGVLVAS